MVQRKLFTNQLKPSSSQHLQEGKNRTPHEFKKKLKKPRSMKLADIETSTTSPSPSPIKTSDKLPNYMKSTTSSDARKDRARARVQSQVSTQNRADICCNTKRSSISGYNKPARNITRSSVRTLTRNPSFKPARASSKKSSKMALCADLDVQKATCSSTLKDSKFPEYLELDPEGTSVMKVCPYTYCSLNGHHHPPMPPLKMFLKAKRRSLRTQKSFKKMEAKFLDGSSRPVIVDEKPQEADADMDFYVEIYAKNNEEEENRRVAETESSSDGDDDQEDARMGSFCFESDMNSEDTDMELEKHKVWFSVLLEVENLDDQGGFEINEDVLDDEVMQEVIEVEKGCFETQIDDSDLEQDGTEDLSEESKNVEPRTQDDDDDDDQDSKNNFLTNQSILVEDCHGEVQEMEAQIPDDEHYNVSDGALDDQDQELAKVDDQDCKNKISSSFDTNMNDQDSAETFPKLEGLFGVSNEEISSTHPVDLNKDEELAKVDDQDCKNKISSSFDATMNESSLGAQDNDDSAETFPKLKGLFGVSNEELSSNRKWSIGCKKPSKDSEEASEFNPREPNYLPLAPDEESEKVDLKHQMMDERRNADEWMLDYALQQTVTKLAPARKRKVALLVEAFESVLPIPRYEPRINHPSAAAFPHTPRPIQACN